MKSFLLLLIVYCSHLLPLEATTTNGDPQAYISFSYRNATVAEVIDDLEKRHDLVFSYSASTELMEFRISARSGLIKVVEGLKLLFVGTPVEHRIISGQIALRYNRRIAEELLSVVEPEPRRNRRIKEPEPDIVVLAEPEPEPVELPARPAVQESSPIATPEAQQVPWISTPLQPNRSAELVAKRQKKRQLGKLSILPGLSTNVGKDREYASTISINAPAGISGGVVGAELGLLFNGIDGDLLGVQFAGGFNVVNQNMTGVQIAGLVNAANIGTGVQVAGVMNYCRRTLDGTQFAPLLNVALNGARNQFSMGLNVSEGDVRRQIGLFNRAQNVGRHQIGLINISDTIAGRPYGLINFVRRGYNVIELSRNSILPYSVSLKMGAHRFYNVFELGGIRRDLKDIESGGNEERRQLVWSFGYGIGWANRIGKNTSNRLHTEIVGTHVNRGAVWQNKLNFILSTRLTYDFGAASGSHFFIGPVMNLHWTTLSENELDNLFVSGWKLFQNQYDQVKFRGILGIRLGLRIGKN